MMDHLIYQSQVRTLWAIHALLQSIHLPGLLVEVERKGSKADAELIQRIIDSRLIDVEVDDDGQ